MLSDFGHDIVQFHHYIGVKVNDHMVNVFIQGLYRISGRKNKKKLEQMMRTSKNFRTFSICKIRGEKATRNFGWYG